MDEVIRLLAALLDAVRSGGRSRMLSPMDAYQWFDPPRVTQVAQQAGAFTQLVGAEVRRVMVAFGNLGANAVINIGPTNTASVTPTFVLNSGQPNLIVTVAEWGSLPQHEWWTNPGNATVGVTELFIREWPQEATL